MSDVDPDATKNFVIPNRITIFHILVVTVIFAVLFYLGACAIIFHDDFSELNDSGDRRNPSYTDTHYSMYIACIVLLAIAGTFVLYQIYEIIADGTGFRGHERSVGEIMSGGHTPFFSTPAIVPDAGEGNEAIDEAETSVEDEGEEPLGEEPVGEPESATTFINPAFDPEEAAQEEVTQQQEKEDFIRQAELTRRQEEIEEKERLAQEAEAEAKVRRDEADRVRSVYAAPAVSPEPEPTTEDIQRAALASGQRAFSPIANRRGYRRPQRNMYAWRR